MGKTESDVRILPHFIGSVLLNGSARMLGVGMVCLFLLIFLLFCHPDAQVSSCFSRATHIHCEHICQVARTTLVFFVFIFLLVLQNLLCPSKDVNRLIRKKACDSFVFQVFALVFLCVWFFCCCSGRNTPILD